MNKLANESYDNKNSGNTIKLLGFLHMCHWRKSGTNIYNSFHRVLKVSVAFEKVLFN